MKYKKLHDHISAKKDKRSSTTRYNGLALNEETGAIYPHNPWSARRAKEQKTPYNENTVDFYFVPGDICIVNRVPLAVYDLVPFGMPGRFETRKSPKSEFTFVHELFDRYESFPGMTLRMTDGKPLDARPLDEIEYNKERLDKFNAHMEEAKRVFFVINRMGDIGFEDSRENHHKQGEPRVLEERRHILSRLFSTPLSKNKDWPKRLLPYYKHFWQNSNNRKGPSQSPNHNIVFENMVNYDIAYLYRHLGIVE